MKLQKLNPFNYLFGRVFVWFWVALVVIIFSAFFLARQLTSVFEINAATTEQIAVSMLVKDRVERQLNRDKRITSALRRASDRGKLQLVTINDMSGELRSNFPPQLVGRVDKLKELSSASGPVLVSLNNMQFIGPHKIEYRDETYSLFVGRLLLKEERLGGSRSTAAIAGLTLAIVLSTAFCFLLVLGIIKPISALRKAANELSSGDLSTRIVGFDKRRDEIGLLAGDFNSMAARLQQVVDNQKQLMANVSHELRTPLTRLQLASALLEEELSSAGKSDDKQLVRIQNEIDKMDKMIGHALTIAKLNSDSSELAKLSIQSTKVESLLSNVINDALFEAKANDKQLVVSEYPNISLLVEPQLITSAVENILRNGLRFAQREVKCHFCIDVFPTKQKQQVERFFVIKIEDDGKGMPKEQISQIFDPFFRGTQQVKHANKGVGLGLAIAKAAIEAHSGDISVESSQLGGLSVIIRLPIST